MNSRCHSSSEISIYQRGFSKLILCSASSDPASFTEITKDCDENKENKTPEGSQGEIDWLQQYDMEREREEQELQQALAQSLQEQVRDIYIATFSVLIFPEKQNNNN